MAYSAIFHGCLRAAMSARRPPPPAVIQLRRACRASAAAPPPSALPPAAALRAQAAMLRSARLPTLLERRMIACLAVEVDRRRRRGGGGGGVASPFLRRQSSSYSRFAYQDVSSDESDLEVGSSQQQQQMESPEGQKMLEFRRSLPAYKEKDALLKAISENQVVVVSGETGCGKTTQLPQYILESEIEAAQGAACNFLLIVLKNLLCRRPELRLILMSATLNAKLFSNYFGGAPMIRIPRSIFDKPPDGVRKIVLATNMAETSYDALNNTPCLLPSWISKAAARQRRGRAGRVQSGECYHLYPRCVYDAFADYQLPELLRTPLQSLCLQIKSLQLGSITEFLSRALQLLESLSVQNAVEYLKVIGALDENENLTVLGRQLSMLPVEPKLGKMLILGAIFNCLDPVMSIVAGLSVRDPFLMPFDKKDLAESAKAQFSGRDYSDHLALARAYDGWRDAERQQAGYEYCWRNFLSVQTMKAIGSLRKQFLSLLKDSGTVDQNTEFSNSWSHDEHLIRAIICAGLEGIFFS
ncbi:hypothetical protein EUGRSUZ_L00064 [Eucalyptus grandis]|uniref:RNA helicase n=3 Tax=Eucalyptus grandis TaxID=71139 RepID=A0AAD9TBT9_EUCGR|nr:hypothetical protein EUGRSUZ_L00064 [Eucalyptus grandis]